MSSSEDEGEKLKKKDSLLYNFTEYSPTDEVPLHEIRSEIARIESSAKLAQVMQEKYAEGKVRVDEGRRFKKRFGFFRHQKEKKSKDTEWKNEIEMDEHMIPLEELLARYGSDKTNGLTNERVAIGYEKYGKNALSEKKRVPGIVKFIKICFTGLNLLLWLGAILAFITVILDSSNTANLALGIVLILVILVGSFFDYYQEAKSGKVMEGFVNLVPQQAATIRNGQLTLVPASELTLGDIVEMKAGEKVPADVRIIENNAMKVDNSSLTGESDPQSRSVDCTDDNPLETKNLAFSSSLITAGTAKGIVVNIGDNTIIGRIAGLASTEESTETPLHKDISRFTKFLATTAVTIGIIFFAVGFAFYGFATNLGFAIGIIVANVPEGLPPTVTLSLTLTAKVLAKKMVLAKKLETVETLGSCTTICSDKTGTLTLNKMTVAHLWFNDHIIDNEEETAKKYLQNSPTFKSLFRIASVCNRATFDVASDKVIGDASESALIRYCHPLRNVTEHREANKKIAEIPFNSTNKFQVSIHIPENATDNRLIMLMKGAPERVFARCSNFMLERDGKVVLVPISDELKQKFEDTYAELGSYGERVLGFAEGHLDPNVYNQDYEFDTSDPEQPNFPISNLTFVGLISLIDPPHKEVPNAIKLCQSAGIKVVMVTGDHPNTAKAIAKQVGIITTPTIEDVMKETGKKADEIDKSEIKAIVVEGSVLAEMTPEDLQKVLENHTEVVFARTSPQQKLKIVEAFQARGEVVAVTGDGVNDSPALKKADIGVAMGINGSEVSKEAADMILLDDNFASIVSGIQEGRLIYDNLKKSVAYTLTSNVPESIPFIAFVILQIPLPISALLILFIDLVADLLPAISLAYELQEQDLMKRGPRNIHKDRLIDKKLLFYAYIQLGLLQCLSGFFTYFMVFSDFGFSPGDLFFVGEKWEDDRDLEFGGKTFTKEQRMEANRNAQTAYFVSILMMQSIILINNKTRRKSVFQQSFKNWWLIIGFFQIYLVAVLICYVPFINDILDTEPIKGEYWAYPLPFMAFLIISEEIRKFFIRKYPNSTFSRFFAW